VELTFLAIFVFGGLPIALVGVKMRVYFCQRHFRDVEVVVVGGGGAGGDGGCSTHSKTITQICARSLDQVVKERNKGRNEERNSFHLVLKQWIWSLGLCATLIELELSFVLSMVFNLFPMFFSCFL
jgi:hypothetical protein